MFKDFNPLQGKRLQLMNELGKITPHPQMPLLSDPEIFSAYKLMVLARQADDWAVALNRQGRMPTYAPNKGQEANSLGSLMAVDKNDWFVPAFRELAGMLQRGIPLRQFYLYWYGNEKGSALDVEKYHTLPISVPIASQCLHAVGLAYASQYLEQKQVAICFVGDGGTSEGDFSEALNFAGVWKAPVIFYVQNNQWAISTPRGLQTASASIAEKGPAFGVEGVQVDGNDLLA
ncbi:MAG: thiamine pyrophosphate-dependent enzyme, partial [Pseudomonadota bacterium]